MQLTVDTVKQNPSGKSIVVKAGGKDYLAKSGMGIQAGMTIEAETKDSQFNGKTNTWIEKWKPVAAAPTSAPAGNGAAPAANGTAWLPFASNTVAHAINAGLIKEPAEVKQWAAAAKQAFEELTK